jgi:transposase
MQVRDTLGTIYTDEVFVDLFPTHGKPAFAPWRLALVTVFQFMEHLTDRQAADAVRDRLAWKYALSLELTDTGCDHTVLSEFRSRLVASHAEQRWLDLLLERCREGGWLKGGGRQRTDSTQVLAKIRAQKEHLARSSDDGLCLECALGGGSQLDHCPWASRMGGTVGKTARRGTLAERGARTSAVRQSSRSRRLDAAHCAPSSHHPRLDENPACCHNLAPHLGAAI